MAEKIITIKRNYKKWESGQKKCKGLALQETSTAAGLASAPAPSEFSLAAGVLSSPMRGMFCFSRNSFSSFHFARNRCVSVSVIFCICSWLFSRAGSTSLTVRSTSTLQPCGSTCRFHLPPSEYQSLDSAHSTVSPTQLLWRPGPAVPAKDD